MSFSRIDVVAEAGDLPPDQVRIAVTRPLEQALQSLPSVTSVNSNSSQGSAGEAVDPTAPVVEIGPGAADAITLSVPADTAHRIRVGDPVTVDTASRQGARGRVSAVVPAIDPTTQSATVTVSGAVIDAVPGDAVTATIVVDHRAGMLVPSSAIVQDPQTGQTVVFVQKPDGGFASRTVTVRGSDDKTALVANGLHAGEHVAAQGSYQLLAPNGG